MRTIYSPKEQKASTDDNKRLSQKEERNADLCTNHGQGIEYNAWTTMLAQGSKRGEARAAVWGDHLRLKDAASGEANSRSQNQ